MDLKAGAKKPEIFNQPTELSKNITDFLPFSHTGAGAHELTGHN